MKIELQEEKKWKETTLDCYVAWTQQTMAGQFPEIKGWRIVKKDRKNTVPIAKKGWTNDASKLCVSSFGLQLPSHTFLLLLKTQVETCL